MLQCLFVTSLLLTIVLQVAVAQAIAQTTGPSRKVDQSRSGAIAGRVTLDGNPVSAILVSLVPADSFLQNSPSNQTLTDEDGRFRMTAVPAGVFSITILPGPFVIPNDSYGPTGKVVAVRVGEEVTGVDLALKRGGIITGQVTNFDGAPIVGQTVTLEALATGGTRRPVASGPPSDTDDQGVYRLYGLPAGRYLLTIRRNHDAGVTDYSTVYYPGVSQASEAEIIEVSDGEEKRNVNIILNQLVDGYSVSGRVVESPSGLPVANVRYRLAQNTRDVKSATVINGRTNEKGEFLSDSIPPGSYLIFALPDSMSDVYSDSVPLVISSDDVRNLEIKVHRGATLNGALFIERVGGVNSPESFTGLWVSASQYDDNGRVDTASTKVRQDGSFSISGLRPGKTHLLANADPPTKISLIRIEKDGQEQKNGIDLSGEGTTGGVRLIATYANSTLRGEITFKNGPAPEATRFQVALMPPGVRDRTVAVATANSNRRFVMTNVPMGDFEIVVHALPASPSTPPAQLPAAVTKRVNITSETNEVVIVFDLAKP